MILRIILWVLTMLVWEQMEGRAQSKFPTVYALYSSGQVFTADYLYLGKMNKKGKADFRSLFFTVIDSKGDSLSHRTVHFLDVKYLLLKPEWWDQGAEYVKEKFAREDPIFLPIALSDGSTTKAVFERKGRQYFYLRIFKSEKVGTSTRRKYVGRDFLFDPEDDYGQGRLLVIATSQEYLQEAKQTKFVRQALGK